MKFSPYFIYSTGSVNKKKYLNKNKIHESQNSARNVTELLGISWNGKMICS